ncbi:MAG: hypothetical protein NVS2B12_09970 [Ktedonobacteraceae bacterium]
MDVFAQFLDYRVKTVAVVDSRSDGPEIQLPYWYAEMEGFKTVHVPRSLPSIAETVSFIKDHAQAAICSNRLDRVASGHFSGAELAAALYDAGIPTLLVTQYLEIDQHTSIRRWRSKLPVVLPLRDFEPAVVKERLEFCIAELQGRIAESRAPYQVMVHIADVEELGGTRYLDVLVGYRDRYRHIRLPASIVPEHLHPHLVPNTWLFAHVNIRAREDSELYFREFVLAPKPQYDEDLVYCIHVSSGANMNNTFNYWFKNEKDIHNLHEVEEFEAGKDIWN